MQRRSNAAVDAILEAAVQILVQEGVGKLTTTLVAFRAGVSVGTLYQYFGNKSAILQAVLKQHLHAVLKAVRKVCRERAGEPLDEMGRGVVNAFLRAKLRNPELSGTLYAISADLEGAKLAAEIRRDMIDAVTEMLRTTQEELTVEPEVMATIVYGVLAGVMRGVLEAAEPLVEIIGLEEELQACVCGYLIGAAADQ